MNLQGVKLLRVYGSILLVAGLLAYVGYGFWNNWGRIRIYPWRLNLPLFLLSTISIFISYIFFLILWRFLLAMMGQSISFRTGYRIWFLSQIGKYLPGRVWSVVGRILLMHSAGMGRLFSGVNLLYEIMLFTLGGLIFFVMTLPSWESNSGLVPSYIVWITILTLCVMLHPRIVRTIISLGLKFMEGRIQVWKSPLRYTHLLLLLIFYVGVWGIIGLSFFLFFSSIQRVSLNQLPVLAGIFVFSWIAGNLAFLAPAGIGVREGTMLYLLGKFYPPEIALVSTIGARMWITVVELIGIGIGFLIRKCNDNNS